MKMLWLCQIRATVVSQHLEFVAFDPPMTFIICLSKAFATSLLGCVISSPYLAPAVFREMNSDFFSRTRFVIEDDDNDDNDNDDDGRRL